MYISVTQYQDNKPTVTFQLDTLSHTHIDRIYSEVGAECLSSSLTLFFNTDSVVKPDLYDGSKSLSLQTVPTISCRPSFTKNKVTGTSCRKDLLFSFSGLHSPLSLMIFLFHLYLQIFISFCAHKRRLGCLISHCNHHGMCITPIMIIMLILQEWLVLLSVHTVHWILMRIVNH